MCETLEEAILSGQQAGLEPIAEIRLGRRQLEAFAEWCQSKGIACATSPGNRHEYNGISIVEVDKDSHRSVKGSRERLLILE
jgi:hypothetical protein